MDTEERPPGGGTTGKRRQLTKGQGHTATVFRVSRRPSVSSATEGMQREQWDVPARSTWLRGRWRGAWRSCFPGRAVPMCRLCIPAASCAEWTHACVHSLPTGEQRTPGRLGERRSVCVGATLASRGQIWPAPRNGVPGRGSARQQQPNMLLHASRRLVSRVASATAVRPVSHLASVYVHASPCAACSSVVCAVF